MERLPPQCMPLVGLRAGCAAVLQALNAADIRTAKDRKQLHRLYMRDLEGSPKVPPEELFQGHASGLILLPRWDRVMILARKAFRNASNLPVEAQCGDGAALS